jgi:hypothetical protein
MKLRIFHALLTLWDVVFICNGEGLFSTLEHAYVSIEPRAKKARKVFRKL